MCLLSHPQHWDQWIFLCDASEEFIDNRFQYFSSSSQHFGLVFPSTIQRMDSRQTVKAKFQQIFLKATRKGYTGHGTSFKSFRKSLSSTSIFFFMNIYLHLSLALEALCALHIIVHQLNYNPSFTIQFSHHSFCELSHMLLCPYFNRISLFFFFFCCLTYMNYISLFKLSLQCFIFIWPIYCRTRTI